MEFGAWMLQLIATQAALDSAFLLFYASRMTSEMDDAPFGADSKARRQEALQQIAAAQIAREQAPEDQYRALLARLPALAEEAVRSAQAHYEKGLSPSGQALISEGINSVDRAAYEHLSVRVSSYRHPSHPEFRFGTYYNDGEGYSGVRGAYFITAHIPSRH